ncbi:hypothetical protein BC936DRAFT_136712 [Jimgerdemannia flammicorona]|uniref:Uncharacterized protein n=2 Tax=Jimgerdemannia flammicorona TaxID=994334 RepID=A0A433QAG4_9FUNG|nr:hypothetical protein BC936DRAFT_136712 [Jimgerdemannia flammicorona]RUS26775.1 hypothetical protein BC938DRAFT_484134 [Jimgerdemannia flammicorona]
MDPTALPRYSPSLPSNGAHSNDSPYLSDFPADPDQTPHSSATAYTDNIRFRRIPTIPSAYNMHPLTGKGRDHGQFSGDSDNAMFKAFRKTAEVEKHKRKREIRIALAITVIACFVRLWKIYQPSSVV